MSNPSRFKHGVSTQFVTDILANYPLPDYIRTGGIATKRVHSYEQDFATMPGTEFTTTGTGTPTWALGNARGGVSVLTTTSGASDSALTIKNGVAFAFQTGYQGWWINTVALSEVTNCLFLAGMVDAIPTLNGIYFKKASGAATVNLVANSAGTETVLLSNVATMVAATQMEFGMYYNGTDLLVYINGVVVGRVSNLSLAGSSITPSFQLTNSTAVSRTATVDYVFAAEEMNSYYTGTDR